MPVDWVYLCSDERRLEVTMMFLKHTSWIERMHVCWCSHIDPSSFGSSLAAVQLPVPSRVVDLSPAAARLCPAGLQKYYGGTGKPKWALGVKLLLPLLFDPPFLYTDDDVLVLGDPSEMFSGSFCSKGDMFMFKESARPCVTSQLSEAVGAEITPATYAQYAADAGVWCIFDRLDWAECFERFSALPYMQLADPESEEFRRADQRFLSAFAAKHSWRVLRKTHEYQGCSCAPWKYNVAPEHSSTTRIHRSRNSGLKHSSRGGRSTYENYACDSR